MVLTGCQAADSTVVTWLVNGQSVESSYLDGRALQGARRQLLLCLMDALKPEVKPKNLSLVK